MKNKILVVDDDPEVILSAELYLKQHINTVITAEKPTNIIPIILENNVDVVLLDMNYSKGKNDGEEGLTWLQSLKTEVPQVEIVLMTAYAEVNLAVKSIRYGASDFVTKPWQNEKLLADTLAFFVCAWR